MGPGPIGGVPSVGVFLRDPSPYLREFRRKPRLGRQVRPRFEPVTFRLPVLGATTSPQLGPSLLETKIIYNIKKIKFPFKKKFCYVNDYKFFFTLYFYIDMK